MSKLVVLASARPKVDSLVPSYVPRPGIERKVAIVGTASTIYFAPWHDSSWEIWGHASGKDLYKRYDVLFDMHPPSEFTRLKSWDPNYYRFLKKLTKPIIMQKHYKEIPASTRYPKEEIFSQHRTHFGNQVDLMIALLLSQGVTHIGLFGIHFRFTEAERRIQLYTLKYWLGFLEGRGVKLVLPEGNPIFAEPKWVYGYTSHTPELRSMWDIKEQPPQDKSIRPISPKEAMAQARTDLEMPFAKDRFMALVSGKRPPKEPLDPAEYPIGSKALRFVPSDEDPSADAEARHQEKKNGTRTKEGPIARGSGGGVRKLDKRRKHTSDGKRRAGARRAKGGGAHDGRGGGRRPRGDKSRSSGVRSARGSTHGSRRASRSNDGKHHADARGRVAKNRVRANKRPSGGNAGSRTSRKATAAG